MKSANILKRFRIDDPDQFRLASFDPADTGGLDLDKGEAKAMLADDIKHLSELQERLYADDHWAVLVVLQAMDAAGKDGVIKHVMTGLNPQGCRGASVQGAERGGARSRFSLARRQAAAVARPHRNLQPLALRGGAGGAGPSGTARAPEDPQDAASARTSGRSASRTSARFERHLARNGTRVIKFFLHVSPEEQRKRLLDRLEQPGKRWKFSMGDIAERKLWGKYMDAYEDMIRSTSREEAPWYVVPADNKPFARLVVAAALIETLEGLDLNYPKIEGKALEEMQQVRAALLKEGETLRGKSSR